MKKSIYIFALFISVIISCTKLTDPEPVVIPVSAPAFSAVNPTSAKVGEIITLTGTNFSTVLTDNEVAFKTATATTNGTIKSATATTITVEVPATATSGTISIKVKGVSATLATGFTANFTLTASATTNNYTQVITFVGGQNTGYSDGNGTAATFYKCAGLLTDADGNLYVADAQLIRKVTPAGVVTTYTGKIGGGNADGTLATASFEAPTGLAFDATGNMYVADLGNRRIRKIATNGTVTTLAGSTGGYADGTGTAAKFENPNSVAVDADGNVFVGDKHRIRKITPAGVVTTFCGTGTQGDVLGAANVAQFYDIASLAFDTDGTLFVCDANNNKIKKVSKDGTVTAFAAGLSAPFGIAFDSERNLYVPEAGFIGFKVRKITQAGVVTTLAGSGTPGGADGALLSAQFYFPNAIAIAPNGHIYVAESTNYRVRKIY